MSHPLLVRSLTTVTLLFFCFVITHAQDTLLPVIFKSEGNQVSFTLKKEFQPAVSVIVLQIYKPEETSQEIKLIHELKGSSSQPMVWQMKDSNGKPLQEKLYLCAILLKPVNSDVYVIVGRILQTDKGFEFSLLEERPSNLQGLKPEEFHKSMTQAMPENGTAWFFYGQAVYEKHADSFVPVLLSPPPPPMAAPGNASVIVVKSPRLSKEEERRIAEEEKQREMKDAAHRSDLKVAQPAFLKASELAEDCQIKDAAMSYLAVIAGDLDDADQRRQWLLKRIDSPCATNRVKAESYYALGVKQWGCAYNLTTKYANRKLQNADPFHFRGIASPEDKQKFGNCLTTGAEYIEKALEADPGFVDAMYYKSLIYREKQKTTANPAERKKIGDEALKIANRATEIMKQRDK